MTITPITASALVGLMNEVCFHLKGFSRDGVFAWVVKVDVVQFVDFAADYDRVATTIAT